MPLIWFHIEIVYLWAKIFAVQTALKSFTFPPASYFSHFWQQDHLILDVHENYQKRSLRNKYQVLGANGVNTLSIPLQKGKHQQQNIRDVKISYDQNWPRLHRETLRACYGSAAFFEHYFSTIEKVLEARLPFLFDFNLSTLECISQLLKKELVWKPTDHFVAQPVTPVDEVKKYPQVFENKFGFVGGLSAIDLLMNMGPASPNYFYTAY